MYTCRIRSILRKYKITGVATFSVFGLASAFSVNVGGFLVLLPKPFWALVDANFVSSYFIRFSILIALAFFSARYATYIVSSFVGTLSGFGFVSLMFASRVGRRFLRREGGKHKDEFYKLFPLFIKRTDASQKSFLIRRGIERFFKSDVGKIIMGASYRLGYVSGRIDGKIAYYSMPLQILALILVLSALFTTLMGSIAIVLSGFILAFFLPPSVVEAYFEKDETAQANSPLEFLRNESLGIFTLQKITLLVLSLSFLSGILHHTSLLSDDRRVEFTREAKITAALVFASSSGFVVYNDTAGYQFIPVEGTQIATPSPKL